LSVATIEGVTQTRLKAPFPSSFPKFLGSNSESKQSAERQVRQFQVPSHIGAVELQTGLELALLALCALFRIQKKNANGVNKRSHLIGHANAFSVGAFCALRDVNQFIS
jgi:hypothetical protein